MVGLTATANGISPTATSFVAPVAPSMMETLLEPLFVTKMRLLVGLGAASRGLTPTATVPTTVLPTESMTETLLQPLLLTTAMGEKACPGNWSAMATELGCGLALVHAAVISTDLITKKSVALDCTPLPLRISTA